MNATDFPSPPSPAADTFCAFGEILWDCLPAGRHPGGAPFNVAAHLVQLGANALLLSAVGQDNLGDELLQVAADKGIDTRFVARAGLPTGTVQITLDRNANATYEIVQPVAWDDITVPPAAQQEIAQAHALVFGSLAARSPHNRAQLQETLTIPGPLRCFDVNLRPPFVDLETLLVLARRSDLVKLNDDELSLLAAWIETGTLPTAPHPPQSDDALSAACATLARAAGVACVCVTRGTAGASFWQRGTLTSAPAPRIVVQDTVGAGDAFLAGLLVGLTRRSQNGTTGWMAGLKNNDIAAILQAACGLGAYVASCRGATPALSARLIAAFA